MSSNDSQSADRMASLSAIRNAKVALRHAMRQKTAQVTPDSIAKQSATVATSILSTDRYKDASAISVYLSMPKGEIATKAIASDAIAKGKTVYVPFITAGGHPGATSKHMDMVSLHSQEDLECCEGNRDKWGIPSIDKDSSTSRKSLLASPETSLDILFIPGLAFDLNCKRLGHGKGFYDRFLASYSATRRDGSGEAMPYLSNVDNPPSALRALSDCNIVGMALAEQVLPQGDSIPVHDSDWLLDALIIGDGSVVAGGKHQMDPS